MTWWRTVTLKIETEARKVDEGQSTTALSACVTLQLSAPNTMKNTIGDKWLEAKTNHGGIDVGSILCG